MGKGWTEERRRKQAENIRKTRPWEHSTGPKTEAGKNRVRLNALKHGNRSAYHKDIAELLRLDRAFLKKYKDLYISDLSFRAITNRLKEMPKKSKP